MPISRVHVLIPSNILYLVNLYLHVLYSTIISYEMYLYISILVQFTCALSDCPISRRSSKHRLLYSFYQIELIILFFSSIFLYISNLLMLLFLVHIYLFSFHVFQLTLPISNLLMLLLLVHIYILSYHVSQLSLTKRLVHLVKQFNFSKLGLTPRFDFY